MANFCPKPVNGVALEIVKLDACGLPVAGPNNGFRTRGFINLSLTPVIEAASDILEYNASGDPCVDIKGCPILRGFDAKLRVCGVNPVLTSIMGLSSTILQTTDIIGSHFKSGNSSQCSRFGMKVWAKTDGDCDAASLPYVAYIFTAQNPVLSGDITFAKDTIQNMEIDFYVSRANASFVDPGTVFTAAEFPNGANGLMSFKGVSTLPTTSDCALITVP